ncbi:hypothetical protein BC629DRAFT_1599711 [Irpex lacteus]|nr:hypothetical protein BC629DRAFT_1599711 [Irpex lacteus]
MASVCITGVQGTGVHPRREIHELVADTRQFSLFVQALLHMQEMGPEDPASYYALAGIYGYPYQPWPASPSPSHDADTDADTTNNKSQWLGDTYNPTQPTSPPSTQPPTTPPGTSPPNPFARLTLPSLEIIEYETLWVTTCTGKREK